MTILIIAGSACLAWLFVNTGLSFAMKRLLRWPLDRRMKPFDCELCLAFWLGVIGGMSPAINFETLSPFPLYTGGCAAVLAVLIKKLLQ